MHRLYMLASILLVNTVSAADISSWSDKTICRLAKEAVQIDYLQEAEVRNLACVDSLVPVKESTSKSSKALAGIDIENDPSIVFFKPPIAPPPTDGLYWFGRLWQMADFNGDGHSDVIYIGVMNPENIEVTGDDVSGLCGGGPCKGAMPQPSLFLGNSGGVLTYSPELLIDNRKKPGISLGRQILVADFNNDKVMDFYIADNAVGTHGGARDSYYLSQVNNTWLESSSSHLSHANFKAFNHGAATGDIDNDGDMDVVYTELDVAKNKTAFWCLYNDGVGFLKKRRCGGSFAFGLELADMDNDGDLDALVGAHETDGSKWGFTGIVWNNGRGQFNTKKALPKHVQKWSTIPEVSAADLDNDGDLDVVYSRAGVLYAGTAIQVLENLGNKKFKDHGIIPLIEAPDSYVPVHEGNEWNDFIESIMFRDVDNDGLMDIYLASGSKKTNGAVVKNSGQFTFQVFKPMQALIEFPFLKSMGKIVFSKEYQEELYQPQDTKHSRAFAKALLAANKKAVYEDGFIPLSIPVPLSQSGASVVAAKMIGFEKHGMRVKVFLQLQYAGETVNIGTCFEYYSQVKFMAVRTTFTLNDWGGVGANKGYGSNYCGRDKGYVGHWEVAENEQVLKDLGIYSVLNDLDGMSYQLLEGIDEIFLEDLTPMINSK